MNNKQHERVVNPILQNKINTNFHTCLTIQLGFQAPNIIATFLKVTGKKECVKHLGYDIKVLEKLWSFNKSYKMKEHPIYSILDQSSAGAVQKIARSFYDLFKISKLGLLTHLITIPVNYLHKDGSIVKSLYIADFKPWKMQVKVKTLFNYDL